MISPKLALLGGATMILLVCGLAYGGRVDWAMALVATAVGLLLTIWAILSSMGIVAIEVAPRRFAWRALAFGAVIAWIALQTYLPVPFDLAHPGWTAANALVPEVERGFISADPVRGTESLIRILTYAGMFWLVVQITRDRKRADLMLTAICCIGGTIALIGLIAHLNGPRLLIWMPDQDHVVRGPFVNRNNFATFAGLTIIVAFGLLIAKQDKQNASTSSSSKAWRRFARGLIDGGWFYLTVIIVVFMALVMSGSRAGIAATMSGILTLSILTFTARRKRGGGLGILFPVLAVLGFGTLAWSGDFLASRLLTEDLAASERFNAFGDVIRAIPDFPLTGVGYGGFAQAYPIYRGDDTSKLRFLLENTYLETIFELGIPMAIVWFGLLGSLLFRCFMGAFRRQRDSIYPMIGASAGILAAVHSMFDYSVQIPAVALLFATILAIGVAQSWSSRETQGSAGNAMSRA